MRKGYIDCGSITRKVLCHNLIILRRCNRRKIYISSAVCNRERNIRSIVNRNGNFCKVLISHEEGHLLGCVQTFIFQNFVTTV